jgi:phosphotransferase system IIA component
MPDGVVIARQARHFVAVIDGAVHDIWDCSHKMVYGYWAKV